MLMVDLDQTLIHTTEQQCPQMSTKVRAQRPRLPSGPLHRHRARWVCRRSCGAEGVETWRPGAGRAVDEGEGGSLREGKQICVPLPWECLRYCGSASGPGLQWAGHHPA